MRFADEIFISNCQYILTQGFREVRPRWEDGTPAHYRFTPEDFMLQDYRCHKLGVKLPVAV